MEGRREVEVNRLIHFAGISFHPILWDISFCEFTPRSKDGTACATENKLKWCYVVNFSHCHSCFFSTKLKFQISRESFLSLTTNSRNVCFPSSDFKIFLARFQAAFLFTQKIYRLANLLPLKSTILKGYVIKIFDVDYCQVNI